MTTTRQLATIKQISALEPIAGADQIVLALVDGWEVIVKKSEFNVGDHCVYFELNSVLPKDNPHFAFLEGKRLCQRKLRGVISQGLAMPVSILAEPAPLGTDVTELLGVTKWQSPTEHEPDSGNKAFASLPADLIATGENRAQNSLSLMRRLATEETEVAITDKLDGTSTSFYYRNGQFHVCGHHSVRADPTAKGSAHYFAMAKKYDVEAKMRALGQNIAIQGELVGDRICGNTLGLAQGELDFLVFYIRDLETGLKWSLDQTLTFCLDHGFTPVPIRYRGRFRPEWADLRTLKQWVHTMTYRPGYPQEGIVVATTDGKQSFKLISEVWLAKWKR